MADLAEPVPSEEDARHLGTVRRLREGESVVACDGSGTWRLCAVRTATGPSRRGGGLFLEATGPLVRAQAALPKVVVAFSLIKGDRTEWAVEKLVEAGADEIVPLLCERTVVRPDERSGANRLRRLRLVARQAAMQARRPFLAEVQEPQSLSELLVRHKRVCLAEPGGGPPSLSRPVVCVGPEGGWSPEELALAELSGAGRVALGDQVLRVETAAVAAAVLLAGLRGGLVGPPGARSRL